jgi:hypothetical protein
MHPTFENAMQEDSSRFRLDVFWVDSHLDKLGGSSFS